MRKGLLGTLLLVFAASPAFAQLPFHRPPPGCENGPDHHSWVRLDYLTWWLKDAPLPVPLAATAPLGLPGATVLYGQGAQEFGTFQGTRAVAGFWFDCEGILGFEGGGFVTEQRSKGFNSDTAPTDTTSLFVPLLDAGLAPDFFPISSPGVFAGTLIIDNRIRLWGYNGDLLLTVGRSSNWDLQFVGGFRYLNLSEDFQLAAETTDLTTGVNIALSDRFQTRNDFYGAEVGFRARLNSPIVFVEMGAKVAFGANRQQVNIAGEGAITDAAGVATPTGVGIFAQGSNSGPHERTEFAIAPEAHIRVGVEMSSHLKVSLGYDFLYINDVVRPGDQLDAVVDLGGVRPAFNFNSTSFYAHGLSLGLELRY